MSWSRRAFLPLLLAPLAGCGFHPLYGRADRSADASALASIKVAPIANRIGQLLEFSLRESLNPSGMSVEQHYTLNVTLTISQVNLGIQRDASATSGEVLVDADFNLTEIKTGQRVFSSRTGSIGAFNLTNDAFAAQVAADDARTRTVDELSEEISARLVLYLRQQRSS